MADIVLAARHPLAMAEIVMAHAVVAYIYATADTVLAHSAKKEKKPIRDATRSRVVVISGTGQATW